MEVAVVVVVVVVLGVGVVGIVQVNTAAPPVTAAGLAYLVVDSDPNKVRACCLTRCNVL